MSETQHTEESTGATENPQWTNEQTLRLQNEWRRLQRDTAYHPFVQLAPVRGTPPYEYQIDYRIRTLVLTEDGQIDYASNCMVLLTLPPGFPFEAPIVRPLSPVFHPNATAEFIQLIPAWEPNSNLFDVVMNIGRLLALQVYDPSVILNQQAMDWTNQNFASLPLHPDADFTSDAGGDPLRRICKFGQRTLYDIQEQVPQIYDYLMGHETDPAPADIQTFSDRMLLSLELLLEPDVPENLRDTATDLFDWARELPASLPAWISARHMNAAAYAVKGLTEQLSAAKENLQQALAAMAELCTAPLSMVPMDTIRQIPAVQVIQDCQQSLRAVIDQNSQIIESIHAELARVDSRPPARISVRPEGELGKRIREEIGRQMTTLASVRAQATTMIKSVQPILASAILDVDSLDRAAYYREYADILDNAAVLVQQILEWGAAGVHAFFAQSESGKFGPCDFERSIPFGNMTIAVRCPGHNRLSIVDAASGVSLTGSDEPQATLNIPSGENDQTIEMIFYLTARCEDLWIPLEEFNQKAREHLLRPVPVPNWSTSWSGQYVSMLDGHEARSRLLAEQTAMSDHWEAICDDLKAVRRYKNRLATHFLLERLEQHVNEFIKQREDAKATLKQTTTRIEEIARRSARDVGTGQMIIPAQFAAEYPPLVRLRGQCDRQIRRTTELLRVAGERIHRRVNTPDLLGSAEVPSLKVLSPLPQDLVDLAPRISDVQLAMRLEPLEAPLGRQIRTEEMMTLELPVPQEAPPVLGSAADSAAAETASVEAAPAPAPVEHDQTIVHGPATEDQVEFLADPSAEHTYTEHHASEESEQAPADDRIDLTGF